VFVGPQKISLIQYTTNRFCQADLAKHVPVSHDFYTYSVRLRPAAEAPARVGARVGARIDARIDATLVHTPQRAAPQYAPLAPVALRRWGIRNSDGDKHTESREQILVVSPVI
jgi:hypothetical protein